MFFRKLSGHEGTEPRPVLRRGARERWQDLQAEEPRGSAPAWAQIRHAEARVRRVPQGCGGGSAAVKIACIAVLAQTKFTASSLVAFDDCDDSGRVLSIQIY